MKKKTKITLIISAVIGIAAVVLFVIPFHHPPFEAYDSFLERNYMHAGYTACLVCEAPDLQQWK